MSALNDPAPFSAFAANLPPRSASRMAITRATLRPEPDCLPPLLTLAELPESSATAARALALRLVTALRAKPSAGGVEALVQEYALSSHEGVALMCMAEALLRIPDSATRDALIRDKLAGGDWRAHLGHSPSMFVNAASWGLLVTGRLVATHNETSLTAALSRLIARSGEPVIRKAVDLAMRLIGEQFVAGQTIGEALAHARKMELRGYRFSYDMLGEAAMTAAAAARYMSDYQTAIQAIGQASAGRGIYEGPGISIKLSALHPRYCRAQRNRVMSELLPRLKHLAGLARGYGIGLNIDAEEASRLEPSLDLFETLARDPELSQWNGLGFVAQAYGKRCPLVIDGLIDLARATGRRIMVRLVKGAYWDSEIKRAQQDGLTDFPVFTRKSHTDVSYLACARKLLTAPDAIFPQFATHNAQTLAAVIAMAGPDYYAGQYEFQCLHGMGEPLYDEVVGIAKLNRPCRVYAPVGTHETLLAYLVRRLLENGANSSFVHRLRDPAVSVETLIDDPVAEVRAKPVPGAPNERILLPRELFGPSRANSAGLDLANEQDLAALGPALRECEQARWFSAPGMAPGAGTRPVSNPADRRDIVGQVREAGSADIEEALQAVNASSPGWAATSAAARAVCFRGAADAMQSRMPVLLGLLTREAGKTFSNAVGEVREAVDFLRYYAAEAERLLAGQPHVPLGPIACISPWNFPISIFTGQVAAALAAGNTVIAKPAEQTPLIAAEAVRLLHGAGIPADVLRLLPGDGRVGAALVADPRVQGVIFTGSTAVARSIQNSLAGRLTTARQLVPLIAETGGLNVLVADSSALTEQLVADVLISAFDSAGQRCSALRILCLQEDSADSVLVMLRDAMSEMQLGNPARLDVDVGPVIDHEAQQAIAAHVAKMRERGYRVTQLELPEETVHGSFIAPTIIEIGQIGDVGQEIFGPVLHVLRYQRDDLDRLIDQINTTGYGLTFGLHSRIEETIDRVTSRIKAGNIYVNRTIIGAVVGAQPFGGSGLSGTGPKAGGPLYLPRLLAARPDDPARPLPGSEIELPGPVGERNVYGLRPRGLIATIAATELGRQVQSEAILATGNRLIEIANPAMLDQAGPISAVLFEGNEAELPGLSRRVAALPGPMIAIQALTSEALARGERYDLTQLMKEYVVSINTASAGGNPSLMSIA